MNKITLTGDLGSGKSATSRILCEKTGFQYLSTGNIQRQIALEMGIDTLELNRRADWDSSIDEKIDSVFIELNQSSDGFIIDSRLAWFFVPNSFKVYLSVEVEVAAARILSDPHRHSETYASAQEAVQKILARKKSENDRFLHKYGADCANMDNFDIIIDTSRRSQAEVAQVLLDGFEKFNAGIAFEKMV